MTSPRPVVVAEFRSVFSETVGGPDKTIFQSAAMHDPRRVKVIPFYLVPVGDPVPGVRALAERTGVEPVIVADRARLDRRVVGEMRDLLRHHGCDLLHTHDFKTDFLGPWIVRGLSGVGLLATAHGWSRPQGELRLRVYNAIDRRVLRIFPLVIAVSEVTAGILRRHGVAANRIEVLHNGVDVDAWRPPVGPVPRPPGMPPAGRVVGSVGRLSRDKDFEGLIEAFAGLGSRQPDLHLVIVGDGPERRRLESLAAATPTGDRIHFLGARDDLQALYPCFDVFALSSRAEGLPNVVLEAMATGRRIVCTRVGGVPELLRDEMEGLLTPVGDPRTLEAALERLLEDSGDGERFATAARARAEAAFSFAARLRRLETLYESRVARETAQARPAGGDK